MSRLAEQILSERFTEDAQGRRIPSSSSISRAQGHAIRDLIASDAGVLRTMEIGCAQGVSSLFICEALKGRAGGRHTIVDPFQEKDWHNAGRVALAREGHDNFDFIEELSEIALPAMVREGRSFDMIFVDGNHMLEHAMIDMVFATKLLRVGGYLIVDDTDMPPVAKALRYVEQFPCYALHKRVHAWPAAPHLNLLARIGSLIPMTANGLSLFPRKAHGFLRKPRMAILKKVAEDQRHWRWYARF